MKLKRVFIIVSAAVLLLLFLYQIGVFVTEYTSSVNEVIVIYAVLDLIGSTKLLCGICALAVLDFLFCVGEKRYNMKMFGIAVALFSLFMQLELFSLFSPRLYTDILNGLLRISYRPPVSSAPSDMYAPIAAYLIVNLLILATFIFLTVLYIRSKRKYLKSQE